MATYYVSVNGNQIEVEASSRAEAIRIVRGARIEKAPRKSSRKTKEKSK